MMQNGVDRQWAPYLHRYTNGEWRATIFLDMVRADAQRLTQQRNEISILDIGCGSGFDNDPKLQYLIAQAAGRYIGVEPDENIKPDNIFSTIHRCFFEDAPIESDSIDIAFAVMVLEHLENPHTFWDKLHRILRKGGVFWGFTVDARHWFVKASVLTEKLRIKDLYLNMLHGKSGGERYENYGVFYRSNTPEQIENLTQSFQSRTYLNFCTVGQMDYYFPNKLRWINRTYERLAIRKKWPGGILAVRLEK